MKGTLVDMFDRNLIRNTLLLYSALAGTAAIAAPSHHIALPAQSLAASLQSIGQTTGAAIAFNPALIEGRQAPAINGNYEVHDALHSLVKDSDLKIEEAPGGTYIIKKPASLPTASASAAFRPISYQATPQPSAQQAPAAPISQPTTSSGLQDIVVTAQKREENLQETPISIAAFSSADLEERGIRGVLDMMDGSIPSLQIQPEAGRTSMPAIGIRGLGAGGSTISRDSTIGIYLDGVYLGRNMGLASELFDIERIEILRGPQGTLFGRNAIGGAVSIVSKKPTGEFGLDLEGGLANFDGKRLAAHLNLPEFNNISLKVDGVWSERGGWVTNPLPTAWDWYQSKRWGVHAAVLWQPVYGLDIEYSYDRATDKSASGYWTIIEQFSPVAPLAPMFTVDEGRQKRGRMGVPLEPEVGRTEGHSLTVKWDVGEHLTIKSISAYRKLNQTQSDNDTGGTLAYAPNGLAARYSRAELDQDQFSQEIQLLGSYSNLEYILGGFYFNEDASDWAHTPFNAMYNADGTGIILLDPPVGGPFPDRASKNSSKSYALFGQSTYTPNILDERLHLTAGIRWTRDKKHGSLLKLKGVDSGLSYTFSSSRVDPAATISFDVSEDIHTYARWGKAYRAGGADSRSPTFGTFGPEVLTSWEIGLKSELFDRRARVNLAAFSSRYKDMQVQFSNPAAGSINQTENAPGTTKIKGFEADVTLVPTSQLRLTGSYTYLHNKIPETLNPFTGSEERVVLVLAPSHALSLGGDYSVDIGSYGKLALHVDTNYSSGHYTHPDAVPEEKGKSRWLLNARATIGEIDLQGARLSVSFWGKNLTNTAYHLYDHPITGPGTINGEVAWFSEPRTYGVDVKVKF